MMTSTLANMILNTVMSTTTECPHHKKMRLEKEAQAMHAAMGHGSADHKSAHSGHHMGSGDHSLHDGMVVS